MLRVFKPVPRRRCSQSRYLRLPLRRSGRGGPGPGRDRRRRQRCGNHLPFAAGPDRGPRRGRGRPRPRRARRGSHPVPQYPRLRHRLPRPAAGRRHGHHHQLAVHGGRDRQPAHRRRRGLALHRLGAAAGRPGGRRTDRHPRRAARGARRRRRPPLAGRLARRRRAGAPRLIRSRHACGRAALLVRNHGQAQGRHAQPPESDRQRGTVPGAARRRPRGPAPGAAPVLPHLRADRVAEPRTAPAGPAGDDAQVRSARVPADHPGPSVQLPVHRPAGGRGAVQAPAGCRVRPQFGAHRPLRRGAAGRGARHPPGRTPRLPGAPGLRHDRDEPRVAPHSA